MSDDTGILSGLHGLRVIEGGGPDLLAAFAIGLVIAAGIGVLLSLVRTTAKGPRARAEARLAALRPLPDGDRLVGLLHLLRDIIGTARWRAEAEARFGLPPDLSGPGIYRPGATPDLAALETAVTRAIRHMEA